MKKIILLVIASFLFMGCATTGQYQPSRGYNAAYQQPIYKYPAKPTVYRIKRYHPMNSGMGF